MTDVSNDVLAKVKALLAKAASTHSEDEADNCTRLAHRLLEKHNLDMSQLVDEPQEGAGVDKVNCMYTSPWRADVATAAASLYFCKLFHSTWWDKPGYDKALDAWEVEWAATPERDRWSLRKRRPTLRKYERPAFSFVGRPHNRAVCAEMVQYLWSTCVRLGHDYSKQVTDEELDGHTRRQAWRDFERGCGERLAHRVRMMAWAAQKAQDKAKQPGNALTLYDAFDEENAAHMATLGLVSRRSVSTAKDTEHTQAGYVAGDKVSLAPQIKGKDRSGTRSTIGNTKQIGRDKQ